MMKSFIPNRYLYHLLVALYVIFLIMPASHAGEIVLCLCDAGHVKIELKLSDECSLCSKTCENSQEENSCFCLDIPISKKADTNLMLLKCRTVQATPWSCIQWISINKSDLFIVDQWFSLSTRTLYKNPAHESLNTMVLLI